MIPEFNVLRDQASLFLMNHCYQLRAFIDKKMTLMGQNSNYS